MILVCQSCATHSLKTLRYNLIEYEMNNFASNSEYHTDFQNYHIHIGQDYESFYAVISGENVSKFVLFESKLRQNAYKFILYKVGEVDIPNKIKVKPGFLYNEELLDSIYEELDLQYDSIESIMKPQEFEGLYNNTLDTLYINGIAFSKSPYRYNSATFPSRTTKLDKHVKHNIPLWWIVNQIFNVKIQ